MFSNTDCQWHCLEERKKTKQKRPRHDKNKKDKRTRRPTAGDNSQIRRQSPYRGLSLFSETSNVKNSCTPPPPTKKKKKKKKKKKNQVSLDWGNVSRFGDKHVSDSGDILPIGRQYEKMSCFRNFQTVTRIVPQKSAC